MRIELLPHSRAQFENLSDRLGMTQVAVSSKVIEWLCEQTDLVQAAILGLYPEDLRADIPAMILKRMAGGSKK
jgi:hypothetical protein